MNFEPPITPSNLTNAPLTSPAPAVPAAPTEPVSQARSPFRRFILIMFGLSLCISGVIAYVLFSFIRLDRPVRALRDSVFAADPGRWSKQGEVNLGSGVTSLIKLGLHFAPMERQARQAISAIRYAEVGLYHLDHGSDRINRKKLLSEADTAMARRGWQRCVGVVNEDDFVVVYVPEKTSMSHSIDVCVAVIDHRQLVIASTSANSSDILSLIKDQHPFHNGPFHLPHG